MKILSFEIDNFKGVKSTKLEVATTAPGNVITLIGLNESGKTTILEAISNFVSADSDTSSIVKTVVNQQRPVDLIPKGLETNFTGSISVRAVIEIDDKDISELSRHLFSKHGFKLNEINCPKRVIAERSHKFQDSDYLSSTNLWWFRFSGTKGKSKKTLLVTYTEENEIWITAILFLQSKFPKVVYFPTFLFNIPDKIYLEDHPSWGKDDEARVVNRYYKQVMQDVADSLENNISLETHIVDRIARHRSDVGNPLQFLSYFMMQDAASQIRAVTNKLGGKIGRVVFSAWNEISGRNVSGKTVRVICSVDSEAGNIPYLQLMIHDGEQDYAIHERSLGFRWFFTFLMFTQFRASRKSEQGTIFLFDEPAANLHARAQIKLLESFGRIASENKYIIYSTHSHYMVNPLWLEKAFIVENKAVDFGENDDDFEVKETDVKVARYRQFVAGNPHRVSYYQPALDALKFSFSPLSAGRHAVIVEGKFDFHPLKYFQMKFGRNDFSVIPAPSASEAGTLISLLRGLGTTFVVMLDDDAAGRMAARIYRQQHLLSEDQVFTLANLEESCEGQSIESIYSSEVRGKIATSSSDTLDKGRMSLFFQELLVNQNFDVELGDTEHKASNIIGGLIDKLNLPPLDVPSGKRKSRSNKADRLKK